MSWLFAGILFGLGLLIVNKSGTILKHLAGSNFGEQIKDGYKKAQEKQENRS